MQSSARIPIFLAALVILAASPSGLADEHVLLPGLDGGEITGRDLEAGPVIVVVWASW